MCFIKGIYTLKNDRNIVTHEGEKLLRTFGNIIQSALDVITCNYYIFDSHDFDAINNFGKKIIKQFERFEIPGDLLSSRL